MGRRGGGQGFGAAAQQQEEEEEPGWRCLRAHDRFQVDCGGADQGVVGEHVDPKGFILVVAFELQLRAEQLLDSLPPTLDLRK